MRESLVPLPLLFNAIDIGKKKASRKERAIRGLWSIPGTVRGNTLGNSGVLNIEYCHCILSLSLQGPDVVKAFAIIRIGSSSQKSLVDAA